MLVSYSKHGNISCLIFACNQFLFFAIVLVTMVTESYFDFIIQFWIFHRESLNCSAIFCQASFIVQYSCVRRHEGDFAQRYSLCNDSVKTSFTTINNFIELFFIVVITCLALQFVVEEIEFFVSELSSIVNGQNIGKSETRKGRTQGTCSFFCCRSCQRYRFLYTLNMDELQ